jgi:hypothetical protein
MNRRFGFSRRASLGPWLAVAALLAPVPSLRAQEETPEEYSKHTHVFRLILQHACHLEFVESFAADDKPNQCVAVVLGDPAGLEKIPGGLDYFLRNGGAVLFATDRRAWNTPLQSYNVRITGEILACDDRSKIYRDSKVCPFIEPTLADSDGLFGDQKRIATNVTSYIAPDVNGFPVVFPVPVLANLPSACWRLNSRWEPVQQFPQQMPFAVGGPVGRGGRLLVLADHSVFINRMMQQTDNDNRQFGFRVAAWLNKPDKRKKILFVEDGVVQGGVKAEQLQALPLPPDIPKPSLDALFGVGNQLLGDLEQEDVFNKVLVDKMPPRWLTRWLLILLTVLLAYYGFARSRRGRHRVEVAAPLLAVAVKRGKPSASAIELRHHSLVTGNNLWEPARALARQFFETALGIGLASPTTGRARLPPFQVQQRGLRGWLMAQRVRRMWRFAHQPVPQPVTMRQFRKFARKVADLKDAVAQGRIRFITTPQPSFAR